jgi:hypothetical protein
MSAPVGPGIPGTRLVHRARFASLRLARQNVSDTGEIRVVVPLYPLLLLCLSAFFVIGDWLLVYWNISTAGGIATVYLPDYFVVEALIAVVAIAAIAWTFLTVLYDVYEDVDVVDP